MAFLRELDDLPREARLSVAAVFAWWPKVDGRNAVASATAGHVRYSVHKPDGTVIQAEANISPTTVSGVSRCDLSIPAIDVLDERYQVRIFWRETGGSLERFDVLLFDVVRYPFGAPWTSLNDLLEERSELGALLDRVGVRLGYATGDTAQTYAAAVAAVHGRIALEARIRATLRADGRTRPALILDRARLARVERLEAVAHVYRSVMTTDEGSSARQLAITYADLASRAWDMVGPLSYDDSEVLSSASEPEDIGGRCTPLRRMQA